LNAVIFPESKLAMKTFRFSRFWAVLGMLLAVASVARADLTSIFTNVQKQVAIPRRTSIIFIQCHGLGYGDLSCYGQTNFQTPNLDKLAAGGMRFNHYAPGDTNMAVAQAALLLGKSPANDGINVAQALQNAGYRTTLLGEWPLPGAPWQQGFDDFHGYLNPEAGRNYFADSFWLYLPNHYFNTASNRWVSWTPADGPNNGGREEIYDNVDGKKGDYMPDYILGGWLQNFVRNNQPRRYNHFRPFFVLVNLTAPRSARPDRDDFPVPSDAPFSDEPWPQAAKNRAALITRLDGDIGRLFEQLNKLGMTNNVAIFFTSSAAPEKFKDPRLNFFRTPADLQSETNNAWTAPMIAYWPGHIPAGQVSDLNWSARDILPTLTQIGFAQAPENMEGHSILPTLLGKETGNQP
jgi:arylsulfatase A-like enzyme